MINSISNSSDFKSHLTSKVHGYYELSKLYMDIGLVFLEGGLTSHCVNIGYMSIKAMLNAVYLHNGGRDNFMNQISFDELLIFTRERNIIDLDAELFLSIIYFLTSQENILTTQNIEKERIMSILNRIELLLCSLSEGIGDCETYQPIF